MTNNKHTFGFSPEFVGYADIKVLGVGGGGGNAINRMIEAGLKGVEFMAINTDAQVLDANRADKRVQIGRDITGGLGAGANPEVGKRAAEENRKEIQEQLGVPNMVFITAGMGGGTGTGAAPVVAEIAKAAGALTVAIVTTPFMFEGGKRRQRADEGLADLKSKVDTLITIPNDRLLELVDKKTRLTDAFATADEVLHQATKGISDLITIPGLINCDFADVRTVMLEQGDAIMGTGIGEGEDRAVDAARMAISSPLLQNVSIAGAHGVLINVTGGEDMTLFDVNTATSLVYDEAGSDANIIFGAVIDPTMTDAMRVTVIATGLGGPVQKPAQKEEKKTVEAPGKPISLFPDHPQVPARPKPQAPPASQPTHQPYHQPYEAPHEPTPMVDKFDYVSEPQPLEPEFAEVDHGGNAHETGGGNGNGNGNGSRTHRPRVPLFSDDDPSIPAYLRRLDDQN